MKYIITKFIGVFITLFFASVIIFIAVEILPGDPALTILGIESEPEAVEALRDDLGLNDTGIYRYSSWVLGLMKGDLGVSWTYQIPASDLILPRLMVTVPLAIFAMLLSILMSIPLGLYAAFYHRKTKDFGVMIFGLIGLAIPSFWLGLMLIIIFSLKLGWLPSGGFPGWSNGFWPAFSSLLLPALALATVQTAVLSRIVRAAVLEFSNDDFVRTAIAKGVSRKKVLVKHVFRNAFITTLTVMGLQFSFLLAGTVVVENVFFLPGLGRLIMQAIANRDLILIEDIVMLLVLFVIIINLCIDVVYKYIDPRLE